MTKLRVFAVTLIVFVGFTGLRAQTKRPFTVADDIGTVYLGDPYEDERAIQYSPDHNYVAVKTSQGRLDLKRPEESLRIYSKANLEAFLRHGGEPPLPIWILTRSSGRNEPVIRGWRWLSNSSGIAFIESELSNGRLVLANVKTKSEEVLTPDGQDVTAFDIRDRTHFAYTIGSGQAALRKRALMDRDAEVVVGTGRTTSDLLFPIDLAPYSDRDELWAVIGGKPFPVTNRTDGQRVVLFQYGQEMLTLSPDGSSIVTLSPVADVPTDWTALFQEPQPGADPLHSLRPGPRNMSQVTNSMREYFAYQYVHIDLKTGTARPLTNAPKATSAGWVDEFSAKPSWSTDGKAILLPYTFLASEPRTAPCIAFVDVPTGVASCVMRPYRDKEGGGTLGTGFQRVTGAHFGAGDKNVIILDVRPLDGAAVYQVKYQRNDAERWSEAKGFRAGLETSSEPAVSVKQSPNDPPVLVVTERENGASRTIWDPNPQLKNVDLGRVTRYEWKDKAGNEKWGMLYTPGDLRPGQRYPLVIQTHGAYNDNRFESSGLYPTGMAARELAVAGILVIQVAEGCDPVKPDEASCAADAYESAAAKLVKDGLVDPDRIGIVGFSRTCYWALRALTHSSMHFKAASLSDGVALDYFQYLLSPGGDIREFYVQRIGALPVGSGLQQWFKESSGFNMDKITGAVQVVGLTRFSVLSMWGVYSTLAHLHKPADIILINTDGQHVLTNPADRLASQGGAVDWFRFWLQDYEDPEPAKKEQYQRWRGLKKLQEENDRKEKEQKSGAAAEKSAPVVN